MDLSELGQTPISEDKPAGEDVRYSQDFDELQQQIDLLSKAQSDGSTTDWERVRDISQSILAKQSKDLNVAVYLAAALQETNGFQGFADGAKLLERLCKNFWDSMYPPKKRMRGRLNSLSWWKERAMAFLQNNLPEQPQEQEFVQGLQKAVKGLDETLAEKTEDAPVLRDMLGQIERIPVSEPEPPSEGKEAEEQAQPSQPKQAKAPKKPQPAKEPPSDVSSMQTQEAEQLFKQGLNLLSSYRDWLIKQDSKDPRSYRIIRWAAWSKITSLPPIDGSFTRLPPPGEEISKTIEQLLSQSKFEQVLQKAESHVPEHLFWLDLSYASARALKGLGSEWQMALKAVETETAFYVQRLPGIENQAFSDGTPFCSQDALNWIESLFKGSAQGGAEKNDPVQQTIEDAQALASGNDLIGALKYLDKALNSDGRLRNRFRLQVAMLKLLIQSNNFELAQAYSQNIIEVIEKYALQEWEPELALEGLQNAYTALNASEDAEAKKQAQGIFSKIVNVNPASALRFSGPAA